MTAASLPADPSASPEPAGILSSALKRRAQDRFSGTLRIDGGQDGTVTMAEGLVIAAATPASPGPESLLLRSGRISDDEWTEAFAAAAPTGRMPAELVDRQLVGPAGLQVLTQVAVMDAVFAMALCGVQTCTALPAGDDDLAPLLPAEPGIEVDRLLRETTRRLITAAEWRPLGLGFHSRPQPAHERADPPVNESRADVLAKVNGRRTVRDIAFVLGRGIFSVMNDLAVLAQDGHLTFNPSGTGSRPRPARSHQPDQASART
ncbi:hypothetical protein [Actinomadura rudentiformis]|uniref:MarR family transcriptional regulator n=1 Tax=Actinomadura rudentiformis TaxID=359158 RepID=A0A6H9YG12_9ACTN|nr:hypothetical protein [Actinomadura rudentiformis]KAB2343684.1 hypothetical protein F8566_33710 [Actinomadura rudentiformis]